MSTFFVEQRVRVRWAKRPEAQRFIGAETIITGPLQWRYADDGTEWLGYDVALDERYAPPHEALEPILPEGAAPSEFETLQDLLASLTAELVEVCP